MLGRPGTKPASKSPSTIMAALSLYLIILAFFIMMNTISQRESSRTSGVLASISSSFKDYPQTTIIAIEAADQGAGEESAPGFEKSIEELFESAFPLAVVVISEVFDQIEVTLPLDSMFTPGGTKIRGGNAPVLDRLANILEYRTPGKFRQLEALLSWSPPFRAGGSDAIALDGPGGDALLAVDRAGALARELTARGVRAAAISIGIERRDPDKLRLLFVTRTIEAIDVEAGDKP